MHTVKSHLTFLCFELFWEVVMVLFAAAAWFFFLQNILRWRLSIFFPRRWLWRLYCKQHIFLCCSINSFQMRYIAGSWARGICSQYANISYSTVLYFAPVALLQKPLSVNLCLTCGWPLWQGELRPPQNHLLSLSLHHWNII